MPAIPPHPPCSALLGLMVGLYALGFPGIISAAPLPPSNPADAPNGQPIPEVTVTGMLDSHALDRAITQFVRSHAKPATLSGQVGRWREKVCPTVSGLQSGAAGFLSDQIENVARSVGAPTVESGRKCAVNVEILFTGEPQALLDHIAASKYRPLLGYYRGSELKQVSTFSHPVQAWYMTGTRSLDAGLPDQPPTGPVSGDITAIINTGLMLDSANSDGSMGLGASGNPESRLSKGLRSEFMHVLVVVDSKKVAKYSLRSISDYIALLVLTRIGAQDSCSGLSSILTLFDTGCGQPPTQLTSADIAYLKALYGADLDMNLALEQSDMHRRMLQVISSK